jgi:hypothetical protein
MYCRYCSEFVNSARRLEPKLDANGDKPKRVPNRRLCEAKKIWVEEDHEMCEEFVTNNSFWCDRLNQCQDIDACRNRVAKKMSKHCRAKCPQYRDLTDALRMRARSRKKVEAETIVITPVATPTIIKRRTTK